MNVKNHGATANDSTDDTAAIQAAVDAVAGTGGTVFVPDGTYMVNALTSILLKSHMTFRMSSGAVPKAIPNAATGYNILKLDSVTDVNVIGGTVVSEVRVGIELAGTATGNSVTGNIITSPGIHIANNASGANTISGNILH